MKTTIVVNNNVNDDKPLSLTKEEFIQWARMIQEENQDDETTSVDISDFVGAVTYITDYCGNWDII